MTVVSGIYRTNAALSPVNNQARKSVLPDFEKRQEAKRRGESSSEVRYIQSRPAPTIVRVYSKRVIADSVELAKIVCVSEESARHFFSNMATRGERASVVQAVKNRAMLPMHTEAFAFLVKNFSDVSCIAKILELKRKIDGEHPENVRVGFFSWLHVFHDVGETLDFAREYAALTAEHKAKIKSEEGDAALECLARRKRSERYFDQLLVEYKTATGSAPIRRTILREVIRWSKKPMEREW